MIAVPVLGHIYYAAEGQGAYLKMGGKRIRLMCSQNTRPEQARLSVSRSHLDSLLKNRLECSKFQNFIPMGSALKYARIAQGEAEGSLRGAPLMEWDIGAADCIVREAGGCITDFQGNDLQYNKKNPIHNDGIIASNRLLHAFFINLVQQA